MTDDIAALRADLASLRTTVSTLSDALYTAQGALLRLMEAEERRSLTLVDTLLGHQGFPADPHGLTTRSETEEALRRRIRRAQLYKAAPREDSDEG